MKKGLLFLVTAIAVGFFTACDDGNETKPNVVSCFNYSPKEDIAIGDEIIFTSCSENAESYAWDFGDGNISTEENPSHSYAEGGEYAVKLTASNESSTNLITQEISIKNNACNNCFTYNNETYELTQGTNSYCTEAINDSYYLQLELFSSGINMIDEDMSGIGNAIVLGLYSTDCNITTGDYTLTNADYSPMTFEAYTHIDYNFDTSEGTYLEDFSTGTVSISLSGDIYTVEFNFGGVLGNYVGTIVK